MPDFDLLVGGPCCQSFSVAGRRRAFEDDRGNLFFNYIKILEIKRPKYFIAENVPNLLGISQGECYRIILEKISELGYSMCWRVLNSAGFGIPQSRRNLYLKDEIVNQDLDKAEKYLLSAEDNEFTQYALGKLYLQKEKYDIQKAISYFEKSADENMQASYQLGRLYFFGADGLEKDMEKDMEKAMEKAMEYLNLSAEQGNEYAQNFIDNTEQFENEMIANTIFNLFVNLSRCIEDDYHDKFQSGRKMIDSKLRRMIQEKNQALGIKEDLSQQHY